MPPTKTFKLGKKDDIAAAVKIIKNMREKTAIFELDEKSPLLRSSDNLKLMKKTAESLGKSITVSTDDEIGMVLAKKAGVLSDDVEVHMPKSPAKRRVARSDMQSRFSGMAPAKPVNKVSINEPMVSRNIPAADFGGDDFEEPKKRSWSWRPRFPRGRGRNILSVLSGLVLICLLAAIFLPSATIIVHARSESITRDFEITVDAGLTKADFDNLEIPGVLVSKEKSLTKHYEATGSRATGESASGSVTLYNFTGNTLTLRQATTTLVTEDGRKYSFTRDVTGLRATDGTEQNPNESTLIDPVPVVAQEPGESQNLPANTRFSVVNAALGNQNVYGINKLGISGGSATATTVVSSEDLDRAVGSLVGDIVSEAEQELSAQTQSTIKLVDSGLKTEVLARSSNIEAGEPGDSFDMTAIVRINGIGFKDEDVISLITSKINQVLSSDKYLPQTEGEYTATFKNFDAASGRGVLAVNFTTKVAYKVNNDNLSKLLAGKNAEEIRDILLSKPEVDTVEVTFWPSWLVRKAPRMNGKIYIETKESQ